MQPSSRPSTIAAAATLLLALLLPSTAVQAQGEFAQGSKIANIGLITGNQGGGLGIAGGFEVSVATLAPNVHLGLGGLVGFSSDSKGAVDVTSIPLLANANVHVSLPEVPRLDLFGGASLGIVSTNVDGPGRGNDDASGSDVVIGVNFGARYYFTNTLAGMLQLGVGDIPEIFLGVSFGF